MNSASAYEKNAVQFIYNRERSFIGAAVVRRWLERLADSTQVLEIGCGTGYPITQELVNAGMKVRAIDSSPTLLHEFRTRFPDVECRCELLQESSFFNQQFGAVVSVGVLFLLPEKEQIDLLKQVSNLLEGGGDFLFTAPIETGFWVESMTGLQCQSLGIEKYTTELISLGFKNIESFVDSGENHYYACAYSG